MAMFGLIFTSVCVVLLAITFYALVGAGLVHMLQNDKFFNYKIVKAIILLLWPLAIPVLFWLAIYYCIQLILELLSNSCDDL